MNRRTALACLLSCGCLPAALAAAPVPRVVYISRTIGDATRAWYSELGFVDGRNLKLVEVDLRGLARADAEARAREVIASAPQAIVVFGWTAFLFQRLPRSVPVVFVNFGGDPVRLGLVESLRRPGRNMTGTCQQLMSMAPKFFEILRELKPGGKRGGVLITRATTTSPHIVQGHEETRRAAESLGLDIAHVVMPDNPSIAEVKATIERARVDYLFVTEDLYPGPHMPEVIAFLERMRIPALYLYPRYVREGGLVSVSFDVAEGHRASVEIVVRILRGDNAATIPVYLSSRYHVAINRRTARAMGIEVPITLLARAEEVVD